MQVLSRRKSGLSLARRVLALDGLPLRPATARSLLDSLPDETADDQPEDDRLETPAMIDPHPIRGLDPAWVLAGGEGSSLSGQLSLIAGRAWWPAALGSGVLSEFANRLWRHSLAVGLASRRLAREANDPDPEAVATAGQLSGLGWWALAAVDPEWLAAWWRLDDPGLRTARERADLGSDIGDLGRRVAERWGCGPLVVDAAWLHAEPARALRLATSPPGRLAIIQEAFRAAEMTPWSLRRPDREAVSSEPRLRMLMAEVQARCSGPFIDPSATPHEERAARQNAQLRNLVGQLRRQKAQSERFIDLLAGSPRGESPEEWADRAARTWCAEPGIAAARIAWLDVERTSAGDGRPPVSEELPADASAAARDPVPPRVVIPLNEQGPGRVAAELWCREDGSELLRDEGWPRYRRAWGNWAALLADRTRLERRLQAAVSLLGDEAREADERLGRAKLEALGEFAAGAGHELNNPLAVIVGRAQLLLARAEGTEAARSLRIILAQAQRAHRILRDLMFVARPPAPRPRACKPPEVLGSVLSEFERECQARGVRLCSELDDAVPGTWADPDGLRHVAEILSRNALQATPPGGRILVRSAHQDDEWSWSFSDNGKGIAGAEAEHLFDPFYCGRQAGRGLGLGLPRAATIVKQAGGRIRWSSAPGHDTTFEVHLPLASPDDRADKNNPPKERPKGAAAT